MDAEEGEEDREREDEDEDIEEEETEEEHPVGPVQVTPETILHAAAPVPAQRSNAAKAIIVPLLALAVATTHKIGKRYFLRR